MEIATAKATVERTSAALRVGARGAGITFAGILLSGPLGMLVVWAVHGMGAWAGAAAFAGRYHSIQALPFFFGFALVIGAVMVNAALYHVAPDSRRTTALIALILTAAFAALIFLNYVVQTTFVSTLVRHYVPTNDVIISALAMDNPRSLAWAIEMWGYGFLGVATWLLAPIFAGGGIERYARLLMVANGVMSVASALMTAADMDWVMTAGGLIGYAAWNLVVAVMYLCVLTALRRRAAALNSAPAAASGTS